MLSHLKNFFNIFKKMDKIYEECSKLRKAFVKQEESKFPSYYWKSEDGDQYLRADIYDILKKRADEYYQKCLDERSIRVPR